MRCIVCDGLASPSLPYQTCNECNEAVCDDMWDFVRSNRLTDRASDEVIEQAYRSVACF